MLKSLEGTDCHHGSVSGEQSRSPPTATCDERAVKAMLVRQKKTRSSFRAVQPRPRQLSGDVWLRMASSLSCNGKSTALRKVSHCCCSRRAEGPGMPQADVISCGVTHSEGKGLDPGEKAAAPSCFTEVQKALANSSPPAAWWQNSQGRDQQLPPFPDHTGALSTPCPGGSLPPSCPKQPKLSGDADSPPLLFCAASH